MLISVDQQNVHRRSTYRHAAVLNEVYNGEGYHMSICCRLCGHFRHSPSLQVSCDVLAGIFLAVEPSHYAS